MATDLRNVIQHRPADDGPIGVPYEYEVLGWGRQVEQVLAGGLDVVPLPTTTPSRTAS